MLKNRLSKWTWVAVVLCCLLMFGPSASAQSIYATLTGVVTDPSQAVVPNAKITLKNTASGDTRRSVTNSDGYFTFVSVPVGEGYELTVEAAGFQTSKVPGLAFTGAEKRNVNVTMKVGSTTETVEVTGAVDLVTPVDSGEKSATLTTKQLQDFSVVGRSAAEFIKILPGFSIANTGTENRANFTGETIGINGNGEGGSQSALNGAYAVNGLPGGSLDITADGAHVSDPGCNCATPVNPNTDMIQEFKVLTSNFSAENQKGPAVISSVAKSGGKDFHGSAYLYARHYSLNSNNWLNNRQGTDPITGNPVAPRPQNKYFFPGGNLSGPIVIPGTKFNRNRDKWFFFTGYEHYFQTIDTGLLRATVPTAGMRGGNFSETELKKIEGIVNGSPVTSSGGAAQRPSATLFPGGIIPANQIDRSGQALMNVIPSPNVDPNQTGGFNYVEQIVFDQNSRQWLTRIDNNISDNTKLYFRYNYQREVQTFPVGLWWRNGNQVPYPTPVDGRNKSDSISASLTHVFSPTMTNEFVFGYTFIAFPNVLRDPSKVDRANVGYNYKGLWKNGVAQIPAFTGWGGEMATVFNPGGFEVGGARGLFADKWLPTFSNNLSKVWGTHTMKFGGFYEYIINSQPANGYTNGQMTFANWANQSTGSQYSDMLTGRVADYTEQSFNRLNNIGRHIAEFFVQDQWKATRRLTLELGVRASHLPPWTDREGFGYSIFNLSQYNPNAAPSDYSGFSWNKRDSSVPLGGFATKALNFAPRVGFAWDAFGEGKTVFRGGYGRFYYPTPQFTNGLDVSAGVRAFTYNAGNFTQGATLRDIEAFNPGAGARLGAAAVDGSSDRNPLSDQWSFTISQRLPFASLLEVSYVGNSSRDNLIFAGAGANINAVPAGVFFNLPAGTDPGTVNEDQFRPIAGFQNLNVITHGRSQSYHGLQASWIRTKGRYNINLNYSWGKQLGQVSTEFDQLNLDNNFGVMPNNRIHVFNAAYSIELGNYIKQGPMFAKALINGWQLSGITQVQSGVNLTGNTGYNFNLDTGGARALNGRLDPNGFPISNRLINGTSSIALRPVMTCNPGASTDGASQVYINPACFALPTRAGQNGPLVPAPVYGPLFQNHDLGMFKNFDFGESGKRLQFRFNAYNFLNMPLWSFISNSPNTRLLFDGNAGSATYGQMTNPVFGRTTEKQGRRIIQLAVKFFF